MDVVNCLCGPHVNPLVLKPGESFDEINRLQRLCWEAVDEIRRLRNDLEQLRVKHEWRPIETAPKDGTPVWVTKKYWTENGKLQGCVPMVLKWKTVSKWYEGWVLPDDSAIVSQAMDATHWQSLPPPPEDK
jgi:hypothetical protein